MRKATPKTRKAGAKPETVYTKMVKAYFYKAFETLEPHVKEEYLPESTEALPAEIFLTGGTADKNIYHDPAPRSLKLIIYLIVEVHKCVLDGMTIGNTEFINALAAIPPTKIPALNDMPEPNNIITATIKDHALAVKSKIGADVAIRSIQLFVKALVEAMLNCIIISKHLPGTKTYLPALCQAASMPAPVIQFAHGLPPMPSARKKSSVADASAADASTIITEAVDTVVTADASTSSNTVATSQIVPDEDDEEESE